MARRTRTRAVAVTPAVPVADAHSLAFRLPAEIRVIIFELADHSCTSTAYLTIVRLSQVCREWRKIIQETSCLWTKLILSTPPKELLRYRIWDYAFKVEHLQRDCSALSTYLHRSGQRSLCLYINQTYDILGNASKEHPDYYALYMTTFIPLLAEFIRRSRIVAFSASVYIPYNMVAPAPAPTAILDAIDHSEVLTNLCIAGTWPNKRSPLAQLYNRLISLEIPDLFSFKDVLSKSDNHLRHLTVLNEESWTYFFDVSGQLTNLVTLHLNVHSALSFANTNDPSDLPPMKTLQNLIRLSITFGNTFNHQTRHSPWSILDVLDLPSLVELELDMRCAPPEWVPDTLRSFFQRSPLIQSLVYTSTDRMTTALIATLHFATQLKHLRVSFNDTIVLLLKLLSETRLCISSSGADHDEGDLDIHTHPSVCPLLESLSATHCRSVPVSKMSRFVAARSPQACPPCDERKRADNDGQLGVDERQVRRSRTSPFKAHFAIMGRQLHQESAYMKDPIISHSVTEGFWLNITKASDTSNEIKGG